MNIKKIRRKCMVRGCSNKETYTVSKNREMGNSIIICRDCAEKILDEIRKKELPEAVPKMKEEEAPEMKEEEAPETKETTFACSKCGKEYQSVGSLKRHEKTCTAGVEK